MKVFVVAFLFFGVASHAYGQGDVVNGNGAEVVNSVDETNNITHEREPIVFKPFPLRDLESGNEVGPDDLIYIPALRKKVAAREYYDQLNRYEMELNRIGYSLRNEADVEVIKSMDINKEVLEDQKRTQESSVINFDDKTMVKGKIVSIPLEKSHVNNNQTDAPEDWRIAQDSAKQSLERLFSRIKKNYGIDPVAKISEPDPVVKKEARDEFKGVIHKEVVREVGKVEDFRFYSKSTLGIDTTSDHVIGYASTDVNSNILGMKVVVLAVDVKADVRTQGIHSDGEINIGCTALNKKIIDASYPLGKEKVDASKDSIKDDVAQLPTLRVAQKYRFAVGPVPMVAEIGIEGAITPDWTANLNQSLELSAGAGAQGKLKVFANAGVDAEIVAVVAGSDLTFVDDVLMVEGKSRLSTDDLLVNPEAKTYVVGSNRMKVLSGSLYFEARATVPGVSSVRSKAWRYVMYDWPGIIVGDTVLFNFGRNTTPKGYYLVGSPGPEDYEDVVLDASLREHYSETMQIIQEINNSEADADVNETILKSQSIRNDLSGWIETKEKEI